MVTHVSPKKRTLFFHPGSSQKVQPFQNIFIDDNHYEISNITFNIKEKENPSVKTSQKSSFSIISLENVSMYKK